MRGGTPHIIPRNVSSGKRLALLVHANWQWGNFLLLVGENALTMHSPKTDTPLDFSSKFRINR